MVIKTKYGTEIEIIGAHSPDSVIVKVVKDGRVTDILKDDIDMSRQEIEEVLSEVGVKPLGVYPFVGA
jgi:hypothetical protein